MQRGNSHYTKKKRVKRHGDRQRERSDPQLAKVGFGVLVGLILVTQRMKKGCELSGGRLVEGGG